MCIPPSGMRRIGQNRALRVGWPANEEVPPAAQSGEEWQPFDLGMVLDVLAALVLFAACVWKPEPLQRSVFASCPHALRAATSTSGDEAAAASTAIGSSTAIAVGGTCGARWKWGCP